MSTMLKLHPSLLAFMSLNLVRISSIARNLRSGDHFPLVSSQRQSRFASDFRSQGTLTQNESMCQITSCVRSVGLTVQLLSFRGRCLLYKPEERPFQLLKLVPMPWSSNINFTAVLRCPNRRVAVAAMSRPRRLSWLEIADPQ